MTTTTTTTRRQRERERFSIFFFESIFSPTFCKAKKAKEREQGPIPFRNSIGQGQREGNKGTREERREERVQENQNRKKKRTEDEQARRRRRLPRGARAPPAPGDDDGHREQVSVVCFWFFAVWSIPRKSGEGKRGRERESPARHERGSVVSKL